MFLRVNMIMIFYGTSIWIFSYFIVKIHNKIWCSFRTQEYQCHKYQQRWGHEITYHSKMIYLSVNTYNLDKCIFKWWNKLQDPKPWRTWVFCVHKTYLVQCCCCCCFTGHPYVGCVQIMRWWYSILGQWPIFT